MIEIPWEGPSVIVPAKAIEVLHQFNQNFNYVPLGQCRDCNNCGELFKYCEEIEVLIDDTSAFCFKFQPREACQNSDKETAARADAEVLAIAGQKRKTNIFELGA